VTAREVARLWHALMTTGLGHERYVAHGSDLGAGITAWLAREPTATVGRHGQTIEDSDSESSLSADGGPAFDRELLLSTLTLYWVTGTITTSLLPYWAYRHGAAAALPVDDPSGVPTLVSIFAGERVPFPKPPRELAERYYAVASWSEYPIGGHFPAVAEPELLARILRDAFRSAR